MKTSEKTRKREMLHFLTKTEESRVSRESIPENIAKNITALRKNAGMTQARLAEELGYSDKSISKWERAEGIPDVICLKRIADLFGVSVDEIISDECGAAKSCASSASGASGAGNEDGAGSVINYAAVVGVVLAGVFLIATLVYVILKLCGINTAAPYVVALPVFSLLMLIFNALWGKSRLHFWTVTLLVWSILFLISYFLKVWLLMPVGLPATLVVWLSCRVKKKETPCEKSGEEQIRQ